MRGKIEAISYSFCLTIPKKVADGEIDYLSFFGICNRRITHLSCPAARADEEYGAGRGGVGWMTLGVG